MVCFSEKIGKVPLKYISGNPILFFTKSNLTVTNNSEFFYSINIPENFLSKGYIEIEIESPIVTTNVDYVTSTPLRPFFKIFYNYWWRGRRNTWPKYGTKSRL